MQRIVEINKSCKNAIIFRRNIYAEHFFCSVALLIKSLFSATFSQFFFCFVIFYSALQPFIQEQCASTFCNLQRQIYMVKFGRSASPPPSNFLHFHEFFRKFWPNNRLAPRGIGPVFGKSWIHPLQRKAVRHHILTAVGQSPNETLSQVIS